MSKPTKSNFCTSVRNAIIALGCSTEMARNVVNAELGNMKLEKVGEESTGELKIKRKAISDGANSETVAVANTASISVKPGTEKYSTHKVTVALTFSRWDDLQAKAEKEYPNQTLVIAPESMFGEWLRKIATPKQDKAEKAEKATS